MKGYRAVRHFQRSDQPYAYRVELRERDAAGKWRLWSVRKWSLTPFWLRQGIEVRRLAIQPGVGRP